MTHDYARHGTTSLFAALEVASGKVHGRCFPRHTHVSSSPSSTRSPGVSAARDPSDLRQLRDAQAPEGASEWLAAHPRFHLHFTPTSASWLNLVERWFALITTQAIRRGSFDSVRQLERHHQLLAAWNENAKPFRWTKSAHQIQRSIRNATLFTRLDTS